MYPRYIFTLWVIYFQFSFQAKIYFNPLGEMFYIFISDLNIFHLTHLGIFRHQGQISSIISRFSLLQFTPGLFSDIRPNMFLLLYISVIFNKLVKTMTNVNVNDIYIPLITSSHPVWVISRFRAYSHSLQLSVYKLPWPGNYFCSFVFV